ncbi:ABC transporter permease [Pseudodesulfovibrio thermohalotolerans]|uniref:ABC transporter permease n=1 Tax=Pseudodesulfovibrio thermohalotolerans TaxID=2880651 RepID=UPI002442F533|nr:ABC transporter permease [Pseudodesulfovibrio thermohalotolerans]WFS62268.1 ABC transporter permease [Pseudodesulfovibrio thermohalotolerans]
MLPLNLTIAVSSLSAHKLRAVLAMLGVFLGALAFTGVQHVSKIMVRQAEMETEKLGPNLYAVLAGAVRFTRGGAMRISGGSRNFVLSDAQALIDSVPSVIDGTPFVTTTMTVRGGGNAVDAQIMACWPNYQDIRSFHPDIGRFFSLREVEDRAKVCVLGRKIAQRLYGRPEAAVGRDLYMFRASFRVIGVMEEKGRDVSGTDQDETLLLPLTTYMRRASNQQWLSGVYLRLAKDAGLDMVNESVNAIMRERHRIDPGEDDDFSSMSSADAIKLQRQALDLMTTLGGITSTISFAVGGMGILSIMILVVRSRRVEIGVRRAVGGRRRDIVRQFLFESGLMAAVGGGLGVVVTVILVLVGCTLADLPIIIDPASLATTLVGSCLLGVAAGAYPAWQAANIEILDVLKS